MMTDHTAVYPGTFDPITNGHFDIIERAARTFETVIVAIVTHSNKKTRFDLNKRIELAKACCQDFANVKIMAFDGLLVEFMKQHEAKCIIRGLRAVSDFEYELQLAQMNRELAPDIETLFLTTSPEYSFLSSTLVKEIVDCGGEVAQFVDPIVLKALQG